MRILGIGEVTLDKSCVLSDFVKENTKNEPLSVEYSVGGPVPSALILLSNLGVKCTLVASIGKDHAGKQITGYLKSKKITIKPHWQPNTKINTYLVNSQNGSRTAIKSEITYPKIKSLPIQLIKQTDLIILDRHETDIFDQIIKHKKTTTEVIFDPSTEISTNTKKILKQINHPIIPEESVYQISNHKSLRIGINHWYQILQKSLIVTRGSKGALLYDGYKHHHFPAIKIKCIDSLGAGDIFRAAFAYGLLQNWNTLKSIKYANLVAALQCTKVGNGTAVPTSEEINSFVKSHSYAN